MDKSFSGNLGPLLEESKYNMLCDKAKSDKPAYDNEFQLC